MGTSIHLLSYILFETCPNETYKLESLRTITNLALVLRIWASNGHIISNYACLEMEYALKLYKYGKML